jgi:hypothetical protein
MKKDLTKKDLKNFGIIWAIVFLGIAFFPLTKNQEIRSWALICFFCFLLISLIYPQLYQKTKFYQTWISFGDVAGKFNSKIIIFFLFFGIFTPIGLILKILKKDLLNKKLNNHCETYFVNRTEQENEMKNQF